VSGAEIAGTRVTVTFEDTATGETYTVTRQLEATGLNSSEAVFTEEAALAAPTLNVVGETDAASRRVETSESEHTIEVTGAGAGQTVRLYLFDASGYVKHGDNGSEATPQDGFHANQLDAAPTILEAVADGSGTASFSVSLTNATGDAPATIDELYFFSAGVVNAAGQLISGLAEPAELKIVEAVPVEIAVSSPGDVVEGGDGGQTAVVFVLSADDPAFTGEVAVTYDETVAGVTTRKTATVTFDGSNPALSVLVDNDAVDDGPETVSIALVSTDVAGTSVSTTPAAAQVTEDDGVPAGTPTAVADDFDTAQAQTVFIPFAELLANDTDPDADPSALTVVDIAGHSTDPNGNGFSDNGALITVLPDGIQALYGPPTTTFTGLDTFSYTIEDADGNRATGTVTVEVTAPFVGDGGPNVLTGTDKTEKFYADAGNDQIDAGGGDDIAFGFTGDDVINGGAGNDKLDGEGGDDQMDGGAGLDFLYGGFDQDTLYGGADTDALFGQEGDDQLFGEAGGDGLDGGTGDDFLSGGTGVDWLYGQEGNDRLDGGADLDALFGGSGNDVFVMAAGNDEDQVFDFEQGLDRIDVSGVAANLAGLSLTQQSGNVLIEDIDSDAEMLLVGQQVADMTEEDFVFGNV
jgi:Ca2+-binding RTX toxin-like protein